VGRASLDLATLGLRVSTELAIPSLSDVRPRPKLDGRVWSNIRTDGLSLVGPDPEDIF
jgi:hypothetical protein